MLDVYLQNLNIFPLRKKCPYLVYLSVFSPNAGKCGKNADQNNSEYGQFLRSVCCSTSFLDVEEGSKPENGEAGNY